MKTTPPDKLTTIITARKAALALARSLRNLFPGESDLSILSTLLTNYSEALTPETLTSFAKQKKSFTTADLLNEFHVSPQKAAGSLAVLTRQGILKSDGSKNGSSAWRWVG